MIKQGMSCKLPGNVKHDSPLVYSEKSFHHLNFGDIQASGLEIFLF